MERPIGSKCREDGRIFHRHPSTATASAKAYARRQLICRTVKRTGRPRLDDALHLRGSGPPRENRTHPNACRSMLQELAAREFRPACSHSQRSRRTSGRSSARSPSFATIFIGAPITIRLRPSLRLPCRGPGDSRGPHRIGDLEPDDILFCLASPALFWGVLQWMGDLPHSGCR